MSDQGATRDIAAAKAGLGSGKTLEAAQKVIERAGADHVLLRTMPYASLSKNRRIHCAAWLLA